MADDIDRRLERIENKDRLVTGLVATISAIVGALMGWLGFREKISSI